MKRLLHVILFIYISVQSVFSDSNDCAAPNFATSLNEYTLCQDGFTDYTIEVEQTNNVPVDEMKWYSKNRVGNNWTEIAGENGNTLTLGTPSDTTFYLFLASNGDCVSDSIIFQLNVVPKPVLAPSYDTVVCKGSSFDIKCPCIEGIATMYEWNEIPSISAVYGIAEIDKDYTFKIFAKHDVCTSEERTINIKIEDPIEITMEEIPSSLCINDEFTFKANVTSGTVDAYHWFVDGVEVFSGSNEFTYTPTQKAKYQLVVDGPICPSVSSPEYDLNVTFDLKVTLEAATPVVCEGNGPRFNPKSNIPSTMRSNLVWEKSMDGVNFEQNLVITDSCPYIYYRIKERVDDRCQWSYSEIVPIKVERRNKSVIKMEPTAICHGDEVHLEAEMETNEFTEYAWYKNGNEISKNNLTLTDTPNDDVTTYEFKVKGDACPTSSSQVTVHMADNTVPIIKEYPSTICEGDSITLEAVDFTANRLYAWVKNRKDTLSNSMTMTDYPTEETTYEFIATGGNCTSMNVPATVNVTHMERPTIDAPGSVCAETPFTIEARIGEGNTGDFIWVKNSTDTIDSSGLTFSDSIDKTTTYQFISTGGICPAKSEPVTIENLYGWEMRLADVPSVICEGESVTLEPMYDISTTKFAWLKDGTDTLSKEEQTLVVSPTKKSSYQVIDLENPCPSGSEIVTIDVITAKETILKDFPETICLGSTVEIEADLATDESNQYAWLKNGTDTIAIGETKLVDSPTETSTYQFISSIPCISNSQVATVKVVSTETPVINAPSIVNEGASVMLEVTSPIEPGSIYAWVKNGSDTIARGKTIITDTPTETSTYEFIITQGSCQNKSNTVTIEVESEEPPVPSDTTVICEGGSVTFTASTFLASNSQIIWLRNGKDTIATDIESFKYSPTITASYQFIVVTGSQKRKSNIEVVKVIPNEKPIIQDAPSLICEGNSITLVTDALVYPNWSYAWVRNGTDTLARSELTLTDLPTGKSTYQFVRGEKCPNKSDIVTIDVTPNEKPIIKETPSSICEGNSVTLEADASVDPNGFYGWVKNGTDTLGKGEMTLTVTPTEETSFQFVRGGSCPNQSDIVTIDVTPNEKPVIKETPSSICEGNSVTLEANASVDPNGFYGWVKNGTDTLGKGEMTLTVTPTEETSFQFVRGGSCPNQSDIVTIDVTPNEKPVIKETPSSICEGNSVTLEADASVDPNGFYGWVKNGTDTLGKGEMTLTVTPTEETSFQFVRGGSCPNQSDIVTIDVTPNEKPVIKETPSSICEGNSVTLEADASVDPNGFYGWVKNGTDTLGKGEMTLTVTPTEETSFQFVRGGSCPNQSDIVTIDVTPNEKPVIKETPSSICEGNSVTLEADASVDPNGFYGWVKNGTDTLGKGEMTLTVTPTEETSFQFVRGGSCPNQSDIVTIDVTPNEKPVIKETPSIVCEGGSVSLEAETAGTPNNDYVWVKNSKDTLTRGVLQMTDVPTETSTYQFVIGGECPNQSEVVTIDVAKKVGLQIATEDSVVCRGENVDITMVTKERIRSGVSPMVEILWEGNGNFEKQEEMESITSDFTIPNVTRPFTIRLAIREDVCPDTLSNILHVEVDTPNKDIKLDSVNICEGESATLHARGLNKFTKITWITADDDTLSGQGTEIIVTPQGTTEYQVIVENGVCLDEASAEVKVHAKPTILSCDAINYNTYYVNAEAASNPLTYHYGGKESVSDTLTNLVMGTTYLVEVIDAEGCIDTLSFSVPIDGIEIPEYFVADRETWKIKGIENFEQSSYKIFDRWGKFLFEGEATDDGWDGAYNGHDLPSTDYWYIINITEIRQVFKGHFTLIRSGK